MVLYPTKAGFSSRNLVPVFEITSQTELTGFFISDNFSFVVIFLTCFGGIFRLHQSVT